MLARTLLAAVALLAAPAASAGPNDLMVVTRDEALQQAIHIAYVQPFTTVAQMPVQLQLWEGGVDTLRAQVKLADNSWDIVLVDPEELSTGCNEGLFEKLDWSAIGGRDHYLPAAVSDCGLGALISDTVLAWDKDKLPVTPSWSDFWDVAKYPGKRGLHRGVRGNLEIALLADGVPPGDVYKVLATSDGVDRAFRKLDQLKPYLVWWSGNQEATKILASGDVLMTSAPSARVATFTEQHHRNFGLQFTGGVYELHSWAIIKGSPVLRVAQQFLYFTGMPVVEQRLLQQGGEGALAKGLTESLPAELAAVSASNPANLSNALRLDVAFWHDNQVKLRQRFDAWLGH